MLKNLLLIVAFLLAGCTQISVPATDAQTIACGQQDSLDGFDAVNLSRNADYTRDAAVKITDLTRSVSGSGTYLKYGDNYIILTAAHVVRDSSVMVAYGEGSDAEFAKVIYTDHENDIAVLLTPELESRSSIKYRETPHDEVESLVGEEVYYTGFPAGHDALTVDGRVIGASSSGDILMHSYAWMGASGSGVYDRRGRLVGVLVAVDARRTPYDPYGMLPPQIIEDVVHVAPIWRLDEERLREAL